MVVRRVMAELMTDVQFWGWVDGRRVERRMRRGRRVVVRGRGVIL